MTNAGRLHCVITWCPGPHIDAIHESFPRDLVIREENVVDVLNDMCSVAHRMALFQVFKSDDLAM